MKKYSYIGVTLVILIFGILVIPEIVDRFQTQEVVTSNRSDTREERAAAAKTLSYVMVNDQKKKVPEFSFVDQHGDTISNEDYRGKVYVVEFFFTTCPTICPIMKENLVHIQNELGSTEDFGIASFSIDPRHDTPDVLAKYAEQKGVTHPNWHLMTGPATEIYELANNGFNIYAGADQNAAGGFAHSGYFALIDREGYIRSRLDQFGNPIIYYRGSVPYAQEVPPGGETPQTGILLEDIKNLLNDDKTKA